MPRARVVLRDTATDGRGRQHHLAASILIASRPLDAARRLARPDRRRLDCSGVLELHVSRPEPFQQPWGGRRLGGAPICHRRATLSVAL